jgi:hypothetical protein
MIQINRLKKRYNDGDLLDISAHYDKKLTYSENKRIMDLKAKQIGLSLKHKEQDHFKGSSEYYFNQAQEYNSKRSPKSQLYDDRHNNSKTIKRQELDALSFSKWKKNPNRYDISGVDGKGNNFSIIPRPKEKVDGFSFNDIL